MEVLWTVQLLLSSGSYERSSKQRTLRKPFQTEPCNFQINHPRYNQRRVSSVKFLGELYNYRMLESTVIFNVLYSFITFGVSYDSDNLSALDPPELLLRIR